MRWPGWNRTSVVTWFKAMAPLPTEQPANGAPAECHPRLAGLTGTARSLDPGASRSDGRDSNPVSPSRSHQPDGYPWLACPRRDSNAHCRSPRDRDSCHWSTRTLEPPPGVEPGLPPYESGAAGRARRRSCRGGALGSSLGSHRYCWGTRIRTWMNVSVSRSRAGRVASYTIPHRLDATAVSPRKGFRLGVTVRAQETEVLRPIVGGGLR